MLLLVKHRNLDQILLVALVDFAVFASIGEHVNGPGEGRRDRSSQLDHSAFLDLKTIEVLDFWLPIVPNCVIVNFEGC